MWVVVGQLFPPAMGTFLGGCAGLELLALGWQQGQS